MKVLVVAVLLITACGGKSAVITESPSSTPFRISQEQKQEWYDGYIEVTREGVASDAQMYCDREFWDSFIADLDNTSEAQGEIIRLAFQDACIEAGQIDQEYSDFY